MSRDATQSAGSEGARDRICVCMATFEPPPVLFREQIESLRRQDDCDWTCVISDDASGEGALRMIERTLAGDPRFVLREHGERVGSYANFERALGLVPDDAGIIAFADQDDSWYPDKLSTLRTALAGGALLAYSDARVVDETGVVLSPTYWSARPNNHTDISALLVANTVTGAASLFRRELLEAALPFPPAEPESHHDHWVALVALALGRIAYVDRPLYDYVQHGGAALGHAIANRPAAEPRPARKVRGLLGDLGRRDASARRRRLERWRLDLPFLRMTRGYAGALIERCGPRMEPSKRRRVERFLTLDRRLHGLPWLAWRTLRASPEGSTLARERKLLRGKLSLTAGGPGAGPPTAPGPPLRG